MPASYATVAEFEEAQSESRRAEVRALRELVLVAMPGVVEHIKWNSPSYYLVPGNDRVTVSAHGTGPIRLILHTGATAAEDKNAASTFSGDPHNLLTWHSNIRASLSFASVEMIVAQRAEVVAVLRNWFAATA